MKPQVDPLDRTIYLTGFMGAGKSLRGHVLATIMRRRFVDMDEELVRAFGMPIAQVFAERGEAAFREAEHALLQRLSQRSALVVATGGGVPASPENRSVMQRSGVVVHIDAPLDVIRGRLGKEAIRRRPLWADATAVEALYESRRPAYAQCDLRLVGDVDPQETARRILAYYGGHPELEARHGGVSCPVIPTYEAAAAVAKHVAGRRVALLTDRTVGREHLERYRQALPGALEIVVAPGERSKSFKGLQTLYRALLEAQFGRDDVLVCLGGGMVTDLGAFAASTYKRGMPFILVSTSLLGCVDAAVGGKAAVNFESAKNQIGLFTEPSASILDLFALETLPRPRRDEGLIEAYKTGLVWDPALAELVETQLPKLRRGDLPWIGEVAARSAAAKAEVVSRDFREGGLRRILNFGHTYGHAVEGWHRCRYKHGQCVAAGMLVAVEISCRRGLIERQWAEQITETLRQMRPGRFALPDAEAAWPLMANDKKNRGGKVVFVLLSGPAQHCCVDDVTPQELQQAVTSVERTWYE